MNTTWFMGLRGYERLQPPLFNGRHASAGGMLERRLQKSNGPRTSVFGLSCQSYIVCMTRPSLRIRTSRL